MEIKHESMRFCKKVRDPRVQGITITDVQMLGDLSNGKSVLHADEQPCF